MNLKLRGEENECGRGKEDGCGCVCRVGVTAIWMRFGWMDSYRWKGGSVKKGCKWKRELEEELQEVWMEIHVVVAAEARVTF